jgi:hypothetical protein
MAIHYTAIREGYGLAAGECLGKTVSSGQLVLIQPAHLSGREVLDRFALLPGQCMLRCSEEGIEKELVSIESIRTKVRESGIKSEPIVIA